MKSAYLYIRVSTDEQKRKGYSLPEQEDRLLKYCEYNNIRVKGIFREDFSAKTFNRPEWKKLLAILKKSSTKESNNILFVKWDRFSRNVEFAYEMIGILRKYNTTVAAIDQPIDFEIPESSSMHAVYLAIPQAENERRSLNTKNGIRRAKQLGRYPSKTPIGYTNFCATDGKKYIAPNWPNANLIQWSFQQLAKNAYRIEDVRRMANAKGLQCSRSNFWKLLHNPVYCGYVPCSLNEFEEKQLVKGIHEPIITEALYYEVQSIINTKRKVVKKAYVANEMLMLHKYLICPACNQILYASSSTGRNKRYPYYHCKAGCKTRFKADIVNQNYEKKVKEMEILAGAIPLFKLIVKDVNVNTQLEEQLNVQRSLSKQIREQELFITKARKLFVTGKIEFDDFSKLKKEYVMISTNLNDEFKKTMIKLDCINKQLSSFDSFDKILSKFKELNVNDKKHMISFIPPSGIDVHGEFSLYLTDGLSRIITLKNHGPKSSYNFDLLKQDLLIPNRHFNDRKISVKRAIEILAQNKIHVDEDEAATILDFLYLVSKFSKQSENKITNTTLNGIRTSKKSAEPLVD